MSMNYAAPSPTTTVPYHDFSGGLSLKRAPYLLDRSQLQYLLNMWYTQTGLLTKRPGFTTYASGVTGTGGNLGLVVGRFGTGTNQVSSVVAVAATSGLGNLVSPTGLTGYSVFTGGFFHAGTIHYWVVTALSKFGETLASAEFAISFPTQPFTNHWLATLNWNPVVGATGYNIYRSDTVSGAEGFIATLGPTTTYSDNGFATPGAAPPLVNTATQTQGAVAWARPTDTSFTQLIVPSAFGTAGTTLISSTQMFDPDNSTGAADSMFICDGANTPILWTGPGQTSTVTVRTGTFSARGATQNALPMNRANSAPITPSLVTVCRNQLIYSGEPTEPTAVYISDPFFPECFNNNSLLTTGVVQSTYIPYFIGRSDGIEGGAITGIAPLGNALMVYKQGAIYRMDYGFALFGDASNWAVTPVSVSVGSQSPKALVRFDTFHVFLGNDGVYVTDGISTKRISDNVSPLFDGPTASIINRTTAVACRYGQRYLLFFQSRGISAIGTSQGGASPYSNAALGSPWPDFTGVWFDFSNPDPTGLPGSGLLSMQTLSGGVYVNSYPLSIVSLTGPQDNGQPVFGYTSDSVFAMGIGYADIDPANKNTLPITTSVATKLDFMEDMFGPEACQMQKNLDSITLLLSQPQVSPVPSNPTVAATNYSFNVSVMGETGFITGSAEQVEVQFPVPTASFPMYATGKYGSIATATASRVLGFNITESSTNPWSLLGLDVLLNNQRIAL